MVGLVHPQESVYMSVEMERLVLVKSVMMEQMEVEGMDALMIVCPLFQDGIVQVVLRHHQLHAIQYVEME